MSDPCPLCDNAAFRGTHPTIQHHQTMPMPHTTPTKEELILAIATHPQLDSRCWELIADAENLGVALEAALANVFPAETNASRCCASIKGTSFWSVVFEFAGCGLFQENTQLNILPAKSLPSPPINCLPNEQKKMVSRHPVLGHPWWDEDTIFHEPSSVDNYLLMSHTS